MTRKLDTIRNIGVIAHIDAGKTTVTERMLFLSGSKHRPGDVDKGNTDTDDDTEERNRGITIYSACVTFEWQDVVVNLLDTPGHVDFTAEVERCLRVLDGAVVVFSAREGVEAQSETVWRQADRYNVPRFAFINKLDREGADFESVLDEIDQRLAATPIPVTVPVGQGPAHVDDPFRGIIDLITEEMLEYDKETVGKKFTSKPIPEELKEYAQGWRRRMLERLYDFSDEMMELALMEEEIPEEMIRRVLREATIARQIQPVTCGSALHGIGVQKVLDSVRDYLPSPAERPPVKGMDPKKDQEVTRKPLAKEPFCGIVFKVLPAKTGDLSWVRVYSGELKANSRLYNPGKDKKDNAAQLWQIHATKRESQVDKVSTGDIVGVIGLRHSITGDTLCDSKHPILLESIQFPEAVISMAVEPENTAERDKLFEVLDLLQRQDPTLQVITGESGQTLLGGMGELHLEVVQNRLLRDFKLKIKFHKPQVSYRETIANAVEVTGECHRQIAGQQLFGEVTLRMEPFQGPQPVVILTHCPPEKLPGEILPVVLEELRGCAEGGGVIGGYPLLQMKVTVLDGKVDEENIDPVAFRIAATDAFEKGLRQAQPVLLEPLMRLDITTPEDYHGVFVNDLQQRRAIIARTDSRGGSTVLEAHAPLKELVGYSSAMRSLSQGRAGYSMEPMGYAPAPEKDIKALGFG